MRLRRRFRIVLGLTLLLPIALAARVAARPPSVAALDLPMWIDCPHKLAAPAPNANPQRRWDDSLILTTPAPPLAAPGLGLLLPNWEVGRKAAVWIPNYEAGMATMQLLRLGTLPGVSP